MHFKTNKYFKQLYLTTLSACICIVLLLISSTYFQMRKELYNSEMEKNEALFMRTKLYMEEVIRNLEDTAYAIYKSPSTQQVMYGDNDLILNTIRSLDLVKKEMTFNPAVHSVYIYNKENDTYYSTYKGMYYTDKDFDSIRNNVWKDSDFPLTRHTEDGWMLTYKFNDSYYSAEQDNAVYVNLKCDWIVQFVLKNIADSESAFYILDKNLNGITPSRSQNMPLSVKENIVDMLSQTENNTYNVCEIDYPEKSYVSYTKLEYPNWILMNAISSKELYKSIRTWRNFTLVLLVISVTLAIVCYIFISKRLYSPISRIMNLLPHLPSGSNCDEFSLFEGYVSSQQEELERLESFERYSKKRQQSNKHHRQTSAVGNLVSGNYILNNEFIKTLQTFYQFQVDFSKPYHVCVGTLDDIENVFTNFAPETEKGLALFALQNITKECLETIGCDYAYMANETMVLLFNAPEDTAAIPNLLRQVQENISAILHTNISFALSEPLTDVHQAASAYKKCQQILENTFFTGRGSILTEDSIPASRKSFSSYNDKYEKKILEFIEKNGGNPFGAKEEAYVNGFISELSQMSYTSVFTILALFTDSIKNLCLSDKNFQLDPIDIENITDIMNPAKIRFLSDIPTALDSVVLLLSHRKVSMNQVQTQFVETAMSYVNAHYAEYELCATSLAQYAGVSSPYLGKLFKQQTGKSIPEYINEVRLAKAAQWLRTSDFSVQEIAERTGYQNYSYFFKLFKQQYGVTPKNYQTQNNN